MSRNDLKVVLEIEKKSPSDENGMFYRYAIGNFKLWFSQDMETGNIYSVGFKENGDALKDFELHIFADEDKQGGYYPNQFLIRPRSYPMTTQDAWEFMQNLKKACRVLDAVEEFFASSRHYALYAEHHFAGEKSIKVEAFPGKGGDAVYSQVYPVQGQDEALKMFREEHPEYKGCILTAEYVYSEHAPAVEKKEDKLISREALMDDILAHLGRSCQRWDSLSADWKNAWSVIVNYRLEDGDLVSREGLLNAVLGEMGCDGAYLGAEWQLLQEAIRFAPAAERPLEEKLADAQERSAGAEHSGTKENEKEGLF